jgi:hypothetical protein
VHVIFCTGLSAKAGRGKEQQYHRSHKGQQARFRYGMKSVTVYDW